MRQLRSHTRPAREAAANAIREAKEKRRRKEELLGKLRQAVRSLGRPHAVRRRYEHMKSALAAYKASFVCNGCRRPTDMVGANVCQSCTLHPLDRCFGCSLALTPATRTWIVQCRDPGIYYTDIDYTDACKVPGSSDWLPTFTGPTSQSRGGFEGPIPMRTFAYYALARWQSPWREDSRRRPGDGGDCTQWHSTYCHVQGSREEMRRLPFCVPCALTLEREKQGAPIRRWNGWQTSGRWQASGRWTSLADSDRTPLTLPEQLHCM